MATDPSVVWQFMNTAHSGQRVILIIDKLGRCCSNIRRRDRINARKDLSRCHATAIRQQLSTNVLGNVRVTVETHEHDCLEVELGTLHFLVAGRVHQANQVVHDIPHKIINLIVRGNHVHTKETRVLVARVKR